MRDCVFACYDEHMIADTYQPTSAAQYAEQSSQAHSQLPDNRFGTFVLVMGR